MKSFAGKKYYFVGAGGIGMSGLAMVLLRSGAEIYGSDRQGGFVIEKLNSLGADIKIGHMKEWLQAAGEMDAVVISAAVGSDNPELKYAKEKGFRVLKYAQMLGQIVDQHKGLAFAGTHGKSSTSGWAAFMLSRLDYSPNYIVGADIKQLEGSSGVGKGSDFIVEACEYDRSFINIRPETAVITNIDLDHLDYYRDIDDIIGAFSEFLAGVKPGGKILLNADDKYYEPLLKSYYERMRSFGREPADIITYGIEANADYKASGLKLEDGTYSFELCYDGYPTGRIHIELPGVHNVYNCLAAIAALGSQGVETEGLIRTAGLFEGIDRRLMVLAERQGIKLIDDYAHHPTEIRASLAAIRQMYRPQRIVCVFQPHQYSRTRFFIDDFAESFELSDLVIVPEIYFVRDTLESTKQVSSQDLVEKIKNKGSEAVFIDSFTGILSYLKENINSGDVVITMGAGDIWKVAEDYIKWLRTGS
ncbi:UDP-N-acetylmuramate--L-alanine ligase [Sedimentisphaera salicampi]|uniref:UDP-N-acetylmuramate--L-alanine ligase n=1 Tax=Sedimentisphaera salicampi TaxID=1941349 RepID=A0A1W6LMX6_9BACT|nr:UDP-N-acetylmuramate--L-alanine ligase [Sedimentisphaera salicampi]ARN57127.1 UDP-N-acetylmuramate--L-alanine ligase [Sedimentisphaera salicampi]OXU14773.1 UDP-N-acetylmuramate--L-alanine ligase [Sedimentisphaera salicampi]